MNIQSGSHNKEQDSYMDYFNGLIKFRKVLDRVIEFIISILMATITIVIFVQVIMRYFFHQSLIWAEELTLYSMVYIVCLGAAYAVGRGQHLMMDILVTRLKAEHAVILRKLVTFIILGFAIFCTVYGWRYTVAEVGQYMASVRLSRAYVNIALFIGPAIMTFYCFLELIGKNEYEVPAIITKPSDDK